MFYLACIKNTKTGEIAAIKVFSPLAVGSIIGWGTDDGVTTAEWRVECCAVSA